MKHCLTLLLAMLSLSVLAQGTEFVAVTDKQSSYSGNPHNFEALSIYWWPDPSKPDGKPYIEKDGQWNPEYKQYDLPRLLTLVDNLKRTSNDFLATGSSASYNAFCRQLDIWFLNKKTRMLPNFNYCQFVPGRNNGVGFPGGIIDAYNFISILDNIDRVDARKSIGKSRKRKLKAWFRDFTTWLIESPQGQQEVKGSNNHGTAYDIILYRFASFIGEPEICKAVTERFARMRVNPQIQTDGSQPQELKRTRAFFYSAYNLEHMLDFCELMQQQGINYIDGDGSRIKEALIYLYPYLNHQKDFKYQEIGSWKEGENILRTQIRRAQALSKDNRIKNLKL